MYTLDYINIDDKLIEKRKRIFRERIYKSYRDTITFVIDSNENNKYIEKQFLLYEVPYIKQRLSIGDFGIFFNDLPDIDQDFLKIGIERKANLRELVGNFFDSYTLDRNNDNRFYREIKRAWTKQYTFRLLIEENYMNSLFEGGYKYKKKGKIVNNYSMEAVKGKLQTLQKYNIIPEHIDKIYMPVMIKDILLYRIRDIFIYSDLQLLRDYIKDFYNLRTVL